MNSLNENHDESYNKYVGREQLSFWDFEKQSQILIYIAGGGLITLGLSPFFKWINFGAGGVTGIAGDGKILLALTILAIAGYIFALSKNKWALHILMAIQGWGIIAAFWMGTLLWKTSTLLSTKELDDNPFAFLLVSQIGPGVGLYLGLLGGLIITGTLGYIFIRHLAFVKPRQLYWITQGIACVIGILLAISLSDAALGLTFPQNTLITPSLINKTFRSNDYRAAILLDIKWDTSKLKKPTRAIKGILYITDIFGEPRVSSKFTVDTPLYPEQEYIQKVRIEYNQFDDSHAWLRSTQLNNMKVVIEVTDIMYLDDQSIQELQRINNEIQDAKKASIEGDYSKATSILDNIISKWQEKYPDKIKEASVLRKDVLHKFDLIEIKKQQIEESKHQEVCAQIDSEIEAVKQRIKEGDESTAVTSLNTIIENCYKLNCNKQMEEARNTMTVIQQKKEQKEQMEQLAKLKTIFKLATENYELLQKAFEIKTAQFYIAISKEDGSPSLCAKLCFKNNTNKTISGVDIDYQTINSSRSSGVETIKLNLSDVLDPGVQKTIYTKQIMSSLDTFLIARPKQVYDSNGNPIFTPTPSIDEERQLESLAEKYSEANIAIESLEVLKRYRELQKFDTKALLQCQIKNEIAELEQLQKESIEAERQKKLLVVKTASYSINENRQSIITLKLKNETNATIYAIELLRGWRLPGNSWMGRGKFDIKIDELQSGKEFTGDFHGGSMDLDELAMEHQNAKFTVEVLRLFDKDNKELFPETFTAKNKARLDLLKSVRVDPLK
ncbi:MAG: hypothetical protein ABSF37_05640 [Sedimentisphaerales bacterium]|jgi:hypothetical protein